MFCILFAIFLQIEISRTLKRESRRRITSAMHYRNILWIKKIMNIDEVILPK